MANELFVFDLDDTILANKHNYSEPILDAVKLIIRSIGPRAPYVGDVINLNTEIDKRRIREIDPITDQPYLYNRRRFPGSLVETYRSICVSKKVSIRPIPAVEQELLAIGERAFSKHLYINNLHKATATTLGYLIVSGCQLVLLSKGDTEIQSDKFEALRNARVECFAEWLIVDKKDVDVFSSIKSRYPGRLAYSVGNMYASDIAPALEAGYRGVYIPDEHWESSDSDVKVDLSRCDVLEDLSELVPWYQNR